MGFGLTILLCSLTVAPTPDLNLARFDRDAYGVASVIASSFEQALFTQGYLHALDRLGQMESARRNARGRLSALYGERYLASDRQILQTAYTDAELLVQFESLSEELKSGFLAYVAGVNRGIKERVESGDLPQIYSQTGTKPEPWSLMDSLAIGVRFARAFGGAGGGELRNLAIIEYLKGQDIGNRYLDAFYDLAPINDRRALPTVLPQDDPQRANPPRFPRPTPEITAATLSRLPKTSLLELLPAIQLRDEERPESLASRELGTLDRFGSYAIVVSPLRSSSGNGLLLSGPQMGFSTPSIVYEIALSSPDVRTVGMSLPGLPGILIGKTPHLSWGFTSGLGDNEDIFFLPEVDGELHMDGNPVPVERIEFEVVVRDGETQTVVQERTALGRIGLRLRGRGAFIVRSTWWGREISTIENLFRLYRARTGDQVRESARGFPMSFNLFFATTSGDIGWQYCGLYPVRPEGEDFRLPVVASQRTVWNSYVPFDSLPYVINPPSGVIVNWNNKPAEWWDHGDTPAWGRLFRNESLSRALLGDSPAESKLGLDDLQNAIWTVARRTQRPNVMGDHAEKVLRRDWVNAIRAPSTGTAAEVKKRLLYYDGWALDGLPDPLIYETFLSNIRAELFRPTLGSFVRPELFELAVSPGVLLDALERRTRVDYLRDREVSAVYQKAFEKTVEDLSKRYGSNVSAWRFVAPRFRVGEGAAVPYSDRGTYIMIAEMSPLPTGRSVLPPGNTESGRFADDQTDLARNWNYKPMRTLR